MTINDRKTGETHVIDINEIGVILLSEPMSVLIFDDGLEVSITKRTADLLTDFLIGDISEEELRRLI